MAIPAAIASTASAAAATSTPDSKSGGGGGLSSGAKAGIAVGVIAGVAVLLFLLYWIFYRRRRKQRRAGGAGKPPNDRGGTSFQSQPYEKPELDANDTHGMRPAVPPKESTFRRAEAPAYPSSTTSPSTTIAGSGSSTWGGTQRSKPNELPGQHTSGMDNQAFQRAELHAHDPAELGGYQISAR
ncbi:MAG: hypothetical protein Q9227_001572 [Pyrenula ochraceoflavens]